MFNDNPSAEAMAPPVGLVVGEVGEGSEANTIDCTSDLLSSVGLPLVCFVQVASLIVSFMLLTMCSLVGSGNNPALADNWRMSLFRDKSPQKPCLLWWEKVKVKEGLLQSLLVV